jgi:hypothetical protein
MMGGRQLMHADKVVMETIIMLIVFVGGMLRLRDLAERNVKEDTEKKA